MASKLIFQHYNEDDDIKMQIINNHGNLFSVSLASTIDERFGADTSLLPNDARALADAIYKDLGLGWLPYPENIPPLAEYYFITMVNISNEPSTFYAKYSFSINAWLSPFGGLMDDEFYKTVAFMKIPTPYQPN